MKNGPNEEIAAVYVLELRQDFSYRTFLGNMMYAYVTCHPDTG